MNRLGLGILSLLLLAACNSEAPSVSSTQLITKLQSEALESDLAWSLLHSLTTEVGPRMAGSDGDLRAVEWSQAMMKSLGFDSVWTEPVSFPRWVRGEERASLITSYSLPMAVTAIGGSPGTGGLLRGEVVRFADLAALQNAAVADVSGKIVFINHRMGATRDGRAYGEVVAGRSSGPYVAAEKGALALVIRSVGTDSNRLPHTGTMSAAEGRAAVPSAAISNPDADLLDSVITSGKAVEIELLLECGFDGAFTSYNVIGQVAGSDPDAGFVALGAHLDSWDLGTGAIDDGAGVAVVLAAAKIIADLPERTPRGLRVILFANEEQGIYGGREYARAHANEVQQHVVGAESDLGSGRIYRMTASVDDDQKEALGQLAQLLIPLGIEYDSEKPAWGGADIGQMRKLGVPAIDLAQDATLYFDIHHTANDTLDKVDKQDLQQNVAAWVTMAWFMASVD